MDIPPPPPGTVPASKLKPRAGGATPPPPPGTVPVSQLSAAPPPPPGTVPVSKLAAPAPAPAPVVNAGGMNPAARMEAIIRPEDITSPVQVNRVDPGVADALRGVDMNTTHGAFSAAPPTLPPKVEGIPNFPGQSVLPYLAQGVKQAAAAAGGMPLEAQVDQGLYTPIRDSVEPLSTGDKATNALVNPIVSGTASRLRLATQDPTWSDSATGAGAVFQHPNTLPYKALAGIGSALDTLSMAPAGVPGVVAHGLATEGGAAQVDIDQREAAGETFTAGEKAALIGGRAAIGAVTEGVGGYAAFKAIPKMIAPLPSGIPRATGAVAANALTEGATEGVTQIGQNALTAAIVDKDKPALTDGVVDSIIMGTAAGVPFAVPSYFLAGRAEQGAVLPQQAGAAQTSAPAVPPPPPGTVPASQVGTIPAKETPDAGKGEIEAGAGPVDQAIDREGTASLPPNGKGGPGNPGGGQAAGVQRPVPERPVTPPPPAGTVPASQVDTTGLRSGLASMASAVSDGYVDTMWDNVRQGKAIPRVGALEGKLRDAQKAGTITSRDDVARMVAEHFAPPASAAARPAVPLASAAPAPQQPPAEAPQPQPAPTPASQGQAGTGVEPSASVDVTAPQENAATPIVRSGPAELLKRAAQKGEQARREENERLRREAAAAAAQEGYNRPAAGGDKPGSIAGSQATPPVARGLRVADEWTDEGHHGKRVVITDGQRDIGEAVLVLLPDGKTVNLGSIQGEIRGDSMEDKAGAGQMGLQRLMRLRREVADLFPTAEFIQGERVGSTGGEQGRQLRVRLRPPVTQPPADSTSPAPQAPATVAGDEAQPTQPEPVAPAVAEATAAATPDSAAPADAPAQVDPPTEGIIDRWESWATNRLRQLETDSAKKLAALPVEQRRLRGSGGSLSPEKIILHSVIGAAKVARGAKKLADWSAAMAKDLGERFSSLPAVERAKVWREAHRIARMDDKTRAEYLRERVTVPASETAGQTTRRLTGQVNVSRAVTEVQALKAQLTAAARGSRAGYVAGNQDAVARLEGFKQGLVRTIRENVPPELHGRFLGDVANVRTLGGMRLALGKASNMLADYELRKAFNSVADLVGKRKLELPRPKTSRALELTEAEQAEQIGKAMVNRLKAQQDGENIRSVDLKTLPEPERGEVNKLIGKAAASRARMRELLEKGGTAEEKQQVVEDFEEVEREIRQRVADVENSKRVRVGKKLVDRDTLITEVVGKVDPKGEAAADTTKSSDAPNEVAMLRRLVRGHASMETIARRLLGKDSDAYRVTIEQLRRGQEKYHDERRKYHDHMDRAMEAAGIPAGSKKLNDWLNKRDTVELPDAGVVTLTRNELTALAASAEDPQTAALIERGVTWTFRNRPRDNPFKLTAADIAAVNAKLTDGERKLIRAFKEYNEKEVTARAMNAKLEMSGWAPDPHPNYFPRQRNRKQLEDAGLPEGWKGVRRRMLENISSMKERAADLQTPLFVPEFIQDVQNYIESTAQLLHLAEPVRDIASVLEHPKVTQAVQKKLGESMNTRLQHFLEESMMVKVAPPKDMSGKMRDALMRNLSRAWLQLNPSPMLKNVVGGTLSLLPEFDARDLAPAIAEAFKPGTFKEMTEASGLAWNRYHGGLYGQFSPLTERRVETLAQMTFTEAVKAGKAAAAVDALPFMEWADSVPLRVAWAASKNHAERTMPGATAEAKREAALAKFHDAIYRTQNGNSSTEISGIGSAAKRGSTLAQAISFLKSDANKKFNLVMQMREENAAGRAKIVAAVGLNALASGLVGYGLKKGADELGQAIGGAPEDEESEEKMRRDFLWDVASNIAGMGYAGDMVLDIARARYGASVLTPGAEAVNNLVTGLQNVVNAAASIAEEQKGTPEWRAAGDRMLKATERFAISGAEVSGVPLVPLYRLGRRAYKAGTFENEDPRIAASKEEGQASEEVRKQVRNRVPGLAEALAEHGKLERLGAAGGKRLTDAEFTRKRELDAVRRAFDREMKLVREGKITPEEAAESLKSIVPSR